MTASASASRAWRPYLERRLFTHFLRTGARVDIDALALACEQKFNPYHDPDDGRFTFKPGGGSVAPRRNAAAGFAPDKPSGALGLLRPPTPRSKTAVSGNARPEVDPVAKRQRDIGTLSAKYEATKLGGPGTISSGRGDPGRVSYGTFQLSSSKRKIHDFIASPEAAPWADQFRGKLPVTKPFDDRWRAIAARDPAAFEAAQLAFIVRTNYSQGAEKVRRDAGYDLEGASSAVRQAFFSTAVQHGPTGGGALLARAVQSVDGKMQRTDPRYESTLINALYDFRTEQRRDFANVKRTRAAALSRVGKVSEAAKELGHAKAAENDIQRRYPRERYDALLLLSGKQMSGL